MDHIKTEKSSLNAERKFRFLMEASLVLSAFFGVYLLITDRSLWILAPSHAYGLIIIVALDLTLAALDFSFLSRFHILSLVLAVLTITVQLGDILTGPQFGMSRMNFASYLFGVWQYDAILLTQFVIIIAALVVEKQLLKPTANPKRTGTTYSRRSFLIAGGTVALLVIVSTAIGLATKTLQSVLGSSASESSSSSTTSTAKESTISISISVTQTETAAQSSQSENTSYETQQDTVTETSLESSTLIAITSPESNTLTTTSPESSTLTTIISPESSTIAGTSTESSALTTVSPECTETIGSTSYLSLDGGPIANVNQLQALSPIYFEYPSGYPNVLLMQPDGTIIALSLLCTHLCCNPQFQCASNEFDCPCHGSKFDISGNVLHGPATLPLPKIELTIDSSGEIFPTGISGSSPCIFFVNVSATPTTGAAPLTVDFTPSLTGGVPPFTYFWSFGDGGTSTSENPSYTYANDGTFTVILRVSDSSGNVTTASISIVVSTITSATTISGTT